MRKQLLTLAASMCLFVNAESTFAGENKMNLDTDTKSSTTSLPMDRIIMADSLIAYGDAENDPIALILAAKVKKQVGETVVTYDKKIEGSGEAKGDKKEPSDFTSVDAVLARAKDLANGRKDLLAMIADVEEMSSRGDVTGPNYHKDAIMPQHIDIYEVVFEGGETAQVVVNGDGDTDLDLFITDENGHDICSDADPTDIMICEFTPKWTGQFTIKIKNLGSVYNAYTLRTN